MIRTLLATAGLLLLIGCANTRSSMPGQHDVVAAASTQQKTALLERMKTLAGTWEMADEKGKMVTASIFSVSSKGSAVREIMFPGDQYEMTNMYHMDGPSLLMVHYCAEGNQPRMRATVGHQPDRIVFKFEDVTNMTSPTQNCMGQLTIIFKDQNNIREEWQSFKNGIPAEQANFDLRRKKN